MNGTLALAASLAAMSRGELRALVGSRPIANPDAIADPLGLAIELLRPESLGRGLYEVRRAEVDALRVLGEAAECGLGAPGVDPHTLATLRLRGLVGRGEGDAIVPLPEVSAALRRAGDAASSEVASGPEADVAAAVTSTPGSADRDTSRWFGEALSAVRRAAALLRVMPSLPARLSRKDEPTAASVRALAEATHDDPERTARLLRVLRDAGLISAVTAGRSGSHAMVLVPTAAAGGWLGRGVPERWIVLARAHADHLPGPLRRGLELSDRNLALAAGPILDEEFPLLPATARTAARESAATAELLGLTVHGHLSPAAIPLFAGDEPAALMTARRDIPPPAAGVYVQPDLTVIVPGPLAPADEEELDALTDTEQLGAAAVLRLSPTSLARARRLGRSTAEIRAVLARLSLTELPQPLEYLLTDLDREREPAPGREELTLAAWLRLSADQASAAPDAPATTDARDTQRAALDALVERVLASADAGPGDLARVLEYAIRNRSAVRVTAASGDEQRTFTLRPIALSGGRLRATDELAGVQRTLPVSAITAVEPIDDIN